MGVRGYGGGGRGRVYSYRYTVTTRMTYIKMGSDESHFNGSLIVRDKVTRQCSQTTTFEETERRAEADSNRDSSVYQPNALPLGQTGSQERRGVGVGAFSDGGRRVGELVLLSVHPAVVRQEL